MFPSIYGIAAAGTGSTPSTLLDDLSAFWTFYEDGGPYADSVASLDLTAVNSPMRQVGKLSYSTQFLSASSQTAFTATNAAVEVDGSFTIGGWIKPLGTAALTRIVSKQNDPVSTGIEYLMNISNVNVPRFFIYSPTGSANNSVVAPSAITLNHWTLILCYYDASVPEIGMSINGGDWTTTPVTVSPAPTSAPVYFASRLGGSDFLNCRLADWGFWKRKLTDDEKTELYNGGLGLTYPFTAIGHPVLPTSFSRIEDSATYDGIGITPMVDTNGLLHLTARRGSDHISADGKLRDWQYNGSWSQVDIYDSVYDDRNPGGGLVASTNTLIRFANRLQYPSTWEDILPLRSVDNGQNWVAGAAINTGSDTRFSAAGALVELPSGTLMQTIGSGISTNYRIFVIFSTDDGVTWPSVVDVVSGSAVNQEPAAVLIDGETDGATRLLCITRPNLRLYTSSDGGANWTELGTINYLTDVGSDHVTPWLFKYGDWIIAMWISRATPNSYVSYVVGRPNSVFSDLYTWSDRIDIYTSTANASLGDQGNQVVFEYNNQLHVAFYDDDAGTGETNIITSL